LITATAIQTDKPSESDSNRLPDISVVIATCGRPEMLLDCVESILKGNKNVNYEIIIVDQDADSNVKHILHQRYPDNDQIKYSLLEKAGASRARNFAVERSRAPIIAFIDDDALAEKGWLDAMLYVFSNVKPLPALVGGCIEPIWPRERPVWFPEQKEMLLGLLDIGNELCAMPEVLQPIGANMAGVREIILSHGGFDENMGPNYFLKFSMITGEEAILSRRIRKSGYPIYYQPRSKVFHRISKEKATRSYLLRRNFWEGVTVITELQLLDELGSKIVHTMFHTKTIAKSLFDFLFTVRSINAKAERPACRMLFLSSAAFSAGVLYGLVKVKSILKARASNVLVCKQGKPDY